jgi:hypothetical protein
MPVIIHNAMPDERRKRYMYLKSLVRVGKVPSDDDEYVTLRREYERNRPRYLAKAQQAAERKAIARPPKSADKKLMAEKAAAWRKKNPGKHRANCRKTYINHRGKVIKNACEYAKRRAKTDPLYKYVLSARSRLYQFIKSGKSRAARQLLGCDRDFFRAYIEQQFLPGMSWENWSLHGWHIDHIRPVFSFDLTKESDVRECFHYTNLRPLWSEDNLRRSKK